MTGILLNVDDTETNRYAKARVLRHAGFTVLDAASGSEALALVASRRPDLVLLDVNLPDMTGLVVCERIKETWPDILVLQTSALYVSAGHRVRGLEGGADAYLSQPVEPDELIATVRALLRMRQAEERLRASEARMRFAQEVGGVGTWEWDPETDTHTWSESNYRLVGVPLDTPLDAAVANSTVHPDDRDRVERTARESVAAGTPFTMEYRVIHADGSQRWLLARADILDQRPGGGRLVGINIDLTRQKQAAIRQKVLIQELHHRVKNTLTIVQAIARQTLRGPGMDTVALAAFESRLANLANTHDLLMRDDLIGGTLQAIVTEAVAPYAGGNRARFTFSGPSVDIAPRVAVPIAMALHELATNAAKYGALSNESGSVAVAWAVLPHDRLSLSWTESGGPAVTPPTRQGFGSRLIERVLAHELEGSARLDYRPDGIVCQFDVASR
ncbi:HWE histidine kinase domain-containing protein [Mongoliimonas terrestris]|uniref:HWE histidine kinase domain-containing protein n=1 Tax=Mongoliimonas terrestris TaxID=1709001 RepID=UPI000949B0B9|nr:HWE histidine kinase domain-containing protein [Mongoliimonas terrestris]